MMYLQTPGGNPARDQEVRGNETAGYSFYSYGSWIAEVDEDGILRVGPKWDFSQTTLKYFKQFINGFTAYRYTTKASFEKAAAKDPRIVFVD